MRSSDNKRKTGASRTKSRTVRTDKELGVKEGGSIKPRIVKKRDGNQDVKIY